MVRLRRAKVDWNGKLVSILFRFSFTSVLTLIWLSSRSYVSSTFWSLFTVFWVLFSFFLPILPTMIWFGQCMTVCASACSLSSFSSSFVWQSLGLGWHYNWSRRLACDTLVQKHTIAFGPGGLRVPPEVAFAMRSWPLLPLLPSCLSSLFSLRLAFDPLRGNSRVWKFVSLYILV